jgi:hypothetical protein
MPPRTTMTIFPLAAHSMPPIKSWHARQSIANGIAWKASPSARAVQVAFQIHYQQSSIYVHQVTSARAMEASSCLRFTNIKLMHLTS